MCGMLSGTCRTAGRTLRATVKLSWRLPFGLLALGATGAVSPVSSVVERMCTTERTGHAQLSIGS